MKKWTVIMLYPDYMSGVYGHDTFMTCVYAVDPEGAVKAAREEAAVSNTENSDDPVNGDDFFVIAVIEGEHIDENPER